MDIDVVTSEETKVVAMNVCSGDGVKIKEFYAITQFPAVVIVQDEDTNYQGWYSEIPRIEEVLYYLGQVNGAMS